VRVTTEPSRDKVARDDVAAVLAAILHERGSDGRVLYLASGDDPIDEVLA
jgi:hypothetical protein